MSAQSSYEWSQERDYQRQLKDADFAVWLDELSPEERDDCERRLESANGY